jgi:hypothetical protein
MVRTLLLASLLVAITGGCKKEEAGASKPVTIRMPSDEERPAARVESSDAAPRKQEVVAGGTDEEEIGKRSAERTAREWLRAARADDDIKLLRLAPSMSEPHTGATLDDDAQRAYLGKLLASSHDWVGQRPVAVAPERLTRFFTRNKVDADLRKAAGGANFYIAADGAPEPTAIFLTVYEKRDEFFVSSAVEIPYKGELP